MFARSSTLLALATFVARFVVATPPSCVIAAVNTQPNPAALQAVCSGSNATAVVESICKNCSSNAAAALSAFASVCSGAGVTIGGLHLLTPNIRNADTVTRELNLLLHILLFLLLRLDDQQRIRDWLSCGTSDSYRRLIGFDWHAHGYGYGRVRQRDSDWWAEWERHALYSAGFGAERDIWQRQW
ncbi:hypothetical protein LTR57_011158 [Friedmanniomyces endolithicus]|nr:hypothetical protein LTR57_011158 [Friedmanniomyces endolithicus]